MASLAKQFSLLLLLILLSSLHTHARESQFFNKMSSANTKNNVVPNNINENNQQQQQQEPNFLPDNENAYGHETGQLPPSATLTTTEPASTTTANTPYNTLSGQPSHKYLPKNYNPTAYVTVPEDDTNDSSSTFTEDKSFTTNPYNHNNNNVNYNNDNDNRNYNNDNENMNYNNGQENYYNGQPEEEDESEQTKTRNMNYYTGGSRFNSQPEEEDESEQTKTRNMNYYTGGSRFNSQPQGMFDTRLSGGATLSSRGNYFDNGNNGFQPQGMSDTRSLENGKYFYDVNTEKYSTNHPYESLRGVRATNGQFSNRNYYVNSENGYEHFNNRENSMGGYQNNFQNGDEEFQNEDFNLP